MLCHAFFSPTSFVEKLTKLVSRFWWGEVADERKIHWVSWAKLCRPQHLGVWVIRVLQFLTKRCLQSSVGAFFRILNYCYPECLKVCISLLSPLLRLQDRLVPVGDGKALFMVRICLCVVYDGKWDLGI
ncbi:hypothetical protein LINPERHAP2_LOCUS26025 [Linum perenne]